MTQNKNGLHTANGRPDWELIDPSQWNRWQKRAAETNGWDTPGNRVSLAGAALTLLGILAVDKDRPVLGTALISTGRYLDLKDGKVADKTGTKSPKGEAVDASIDKFMMLAALGIFPSKGVMARKGILPKWAARGLYTHHSANNVATGIAKKRGVDMHPSSLGKKSTFLQWASIGVGLAAKIAESRGATETEQKLKRLEKIGLGVGIGLGAVSTLGYFRQALAKKPTA